MNNDAIEKKNTLYAHDDTEIPYSSRLDANLCKSVSIGTAGRFIPTSGGANSQKNIYQYLLSLFLFPRITWERCEDEDKTTIMFLGQNILGAIAFRLRNCNMNMDISKVVANFWATCASNTRCPPGRPKHTFLNCAPHFLPVVQLW